MQTTKPTPADLSPLFQEHYAKFLEARDVYRDSQENYQQTLQETARLEQAALALDGEAEQANANWKEMAKARHADQRKINQEVERSVQLKMEAEKYRRTASVREELRGQIVVHMAKARADLNAQCTAVRGLYREERIAALMAALATEGVPELLRELRDLAGEDFNGLVAKTANKAEPSVTNFLDGIHAPNIIRGEIVPQNGMEMRRLEMTGGKSTSLTAQQ